MMKQVGSSNSRCLAELAVRITDVRTTLRIAVLPEQRSEQSRDTITQVLLTLDDVIMGLMEVLDDIDE